MSSLRRSDECVRSAEQKKKENKRFRHFAIFQMTLPAADL